MIKITSENLGKFNAHYPRLVAIITAHAAGRTNAMTVAWHTPISFTPPLYGVSVAPNRFTYRLIIESQQFGINFLPIEAAQLAAAIGGSKGQNINKFHKFNIAVEEPVKTSVPILKEAYAAYECQLVDDVAYGDHKLLVGEIVAVHTGKESFTPEEVLDLHNVNPLLYLGHDTYLTTATDSLLHLDKKVYGERALTNHSVNDDQWFI